MTSLEDVRICVEKTHQSLVGYQLAEFAKSSQLRVYLFILQSLVAVPAALSVVIVDDTWLYSLAILGAVLLVAWWVVSLLYEKSREAAQTARRASLLSGALGETFSAYELMELRQRFTVTEAQANAYENPEYYATQQKPGAHRLAEMLEESAFFTSNLQSFSSKVMGFILIAFVVVAGGLALTLGINLDRSSSITFVRIVLSAFVFAMSSDVFGAFLKHLSAAARTEAIKSRLATLQQRDASLIDVLLVMTDYNSAVESAPESVPFAFRLREAKLNARWAEYVADKATSNAFKE
ncbi:hypothetical protein ABEB22_10860 [Thioclava sp. 'Guangxiensis']|uniref:hypothetical protein n=1 Tax=Thioclava sp. 'Guangxiensis' TaxID=3149044 RepID=UPI003877B6DC